MHNNKFNKKNSMKANLNVALVNQYLLSLITQYFHLQGTEVS